MQNVDFLTISCLLCVRILLEVGAKRRIYELGLSTLYDHQSNHEHIISSCSTLVGVDTIILNILKGAGLHGLIFIHLNLMSQLGLCDVYVDSIIVD